MTPYEIGLHAIIIALFVHVALWAGIAVMAMRETRGLRKRDQGHSGGLSEVYIVATEYSGLIDMYLEAHATHWFREKVKGGK